MKAMKKVFMLLGLALGMLTVGCTAGLNEEATLNNKVEIGVVLDDAARLQLIGQTASAVQLGWAEGDVIYVNGVKSEPIAAAYVGKSEGKFFVSGVTAPYEVIYAPKVVGAEGEVVLPASRKWTAETLGGDVAVFTGKSETTAVSLEALVGFVYVTVTGVPTDVCSATVQAVNGEGLAGDAAVDFVADELHTTDYLSAIEINDIAVEAGVAQFIASVPAQVYAGGFNVVITAGDTEMVKTIGVGAGVEVKKGVAMVMPEVAYAGTPRALTIKSAADLQAFLTAVDAGDYAAYVNGAGEVVVDNDIDLTGVTLQGSLASGDAAFKHVFNGKGHSLKNWTVTSALFADNAGTIKNFVIDESCVWNPVFNDNQALVVLMNNGIVSDITSNVDITKDMFDTEATTTLGAIVARTYAPVLNCVNNGDFTFTNVYWNTGNIYLGGVVGYGWYNAGEILLSNCQNNGDIKIVCADGVVGKNAYIGGVFGSTSQNGYKTRTSTADSFGVIYNCVNTGDIHIERKELNSGSYANIAGVVGYAEADVVACVNKGNVSYIAPNNLAAAGASTRPCVGGVAAVAVYYMCDCVNDGEITMTGTYAAGGTSGETAGIGASGNPCFGGVVGQAGHNAIEGCFVERCVNNGAVNFLATMRSANSTGAQVGGVIGLSNNHVKDCVNNAKFTINECFATTYVGGVVGRMYYSPFTVENCENNGEIDYTPYETEKATQIYIGGIVGHGKSCQVLNSVNNKNISFADGHKATANSYIGGIAGQYDGTDCVISGSSNHGDLTVLASTKWRAGGIAGCAGGNITGCYNDGDVTTLTNTDGVIGGINGFGQAHITDSETYCTLKGNSTTPCGGLVGSHGNTSQNWNGNTVKVEIVAEGALCGILCGSNTASGEKLSTVGDVAPNKVITGTKINGVDVTAADCADILKVYGGITNMANAVLIDGGVVFVAE